MEVFWYAVMAWFGWIAAPFIFFFGLFMLVFVGALLVLAVRWISAATRKLRRRIQRWAKA